MIEFNNYKGFDFTTVNKVSGGVVEIETSRIIGGELTIKTTFDSKRGEYVASAISGSGSEELGSLPVQNPLTALKEAQKFHDKIVKLRSKDVLGRVIGC